jgi:hypothetical protein
MFGTGSKQNITHNINKILLYITCGCGDITDLGFHISISHAKFIRKKHRQALQKL